MQRVPQSQYLRGFPKASLGSVPSNVPTVSLSETSNDVYLIELGRNSLSERMVFRLCDALDITPLDMLKDVERQMRVPATGHITTATD